ncbi:hypothetical protein KFK09_015335 [Dendrobium nobile]|uniref:NHL repeat-containing protein n=1 Tax=Dendrobium nobile TaxID=94219 RepID=A0A8T3B6Y3_DENNO|nr:hypothetical protein KFK09_015335 [Dendrobium nobile]
MEMDERKKGFSALLVLVLLLSGFSLVSAASPAKLVSGFISNGLSAIFKLLWSMASTKKTDSRPKLVAGSVEGYVGHVDGRPREARMNRPKGLTIDDRGNIYVADSLNMAIRKVSDTGVTTIAGGKWNKGGHMDGPIVYIGSSCSLLVVDRGNQAIREIQLHFDDCAYQYENSFPLGLAVLFAAGFFGYMLALLQRRVGVMISSQDANYQEILKASASIKSRSSVLQKSSWESGRPTLVSTEDDLKKQDEEEGFLTSMVKLLSGAKSSLAEIVGALFSRKTQASEHQVAHRQQQRPNSWPVQESFIIPEEDEPPPVEAKTPTPRKTYAFMSKNQAKIHQLRQGQAYFNHWDGKMQQTNNIISSRCTSTSSIPWPRKLTMSRTMRLRMRLSLELCKNWIAVLVRWRLKQKTIGTSSMISMACAQG